MSRTVTQLLPLQYVPINSVAVSSGFDTTYLMAVTVHMSFCQTQNDNHLVNPAVFRVEGQIQDGANFWLPLATWEPKTQSPGSTTVLNTAPTGSTEVDISGIPFLWRAGQLLYINHRFESSPNDTSKSEFIRLLRTETGTPAKAVFETPTLFDHSDTVNETAYILNNAERWIGQINVAAIKQIRVVVDGSMCDRDFVAEVFLTSRDPD